MPSSSSQQQLHALRHSRRRMASASVPGVAGAILRGCFNQARHLLLNDDSSSMLIDEPEPLDGRTPLILCALIRDPAWSCSLARQLLEHGARVGARDRRHGMNALHYACACGRLQLARLFLQAIDYRLDAPDRHGNTALHYAVLSPSGSDQLIRLLASVLHRYQLPTATPNRAGLTPLSLAQFCERREAVRTLLEFEEPPVASRTTTPGAINGYVNSATALALMYRPNEPDFIATAGSPPDQQPLDVAELFRQQTVSDRASAAAARVANGGANRSRCVSAKRDIPRLFSNYEFHCSPLYRPPPRSPDPRLYATDYFLRFQPPPPPLAQQSGRAGEMAAGDAANGVGGDAGVGGRRRRDGPSGSRRSKRTSTATAASLNTNGGGEVGGSSRRRPGRISRVAFNRDEP